jgi:aspartate racemase
VGDSAIADASKRRVKTIGIVGGIAPASTIEYYKYLIDAYRQKSPGGEYPSIVINSIDPRRMLGMMDAGNLPGTVEYLVSALHVLANAGVDLALFGSNTPHLLFDEIRRQSPVSLISIVDATRDEALRRGLRRVGLLGTGFTMRATFYRDAFADAGILLVSPDAADIDLVHDKYMVELVPGVYRDDTRDAILGVIDRMRTAHNLDGMVFGGTELPLLIPPDSHPELGILDTMRAHVDAAVAVMVE